MDMQLLAWVGVGFLLATAAWAPVVFLVERRADHWRREAYRQDALADSAYRQALAELSGRVKG